MPQRNAMAQRHAYLNECFGHGADLTTERNFTRNPWAAVRARAPHADTAQKDLQTMPNAVAQEQPDPELEPLREAA